MRLRTAEHIGPERYLPVLRADPRPGVIPYRNVLEQHSEPGNLVIGEVAAGPMTLERRAYRDAAGLQQRLVTPPEGHAPEQRRQPAVCPFGRATHRLPGRALDRCHPTGESRPVG